jgi:Zn-dependent alcohol dehydrogenase
VIWLLPLAFLVVAVGRAVAALMPTAVPVTALTRPCAECPLPAKPGRAYCSTRCRNAADRHDELDGDL